MKDFPGVMTAPYERPCFVVQDWVRFLSFKQQTVLLVALRGFDGVGKHDPSKPLIKALRMTLLHNADPQNSGFMQFNLTGKQVEDFLEDESHSYPMHWLMHFAHAAEIIGYEYPTREVQSWWRDFYFRVCKVLHVKPETRDEMKERLSDYV